MSKLDTEEKQAANRIRCMDNYRRNKEKRLAKMKEWAGKNKEKVSADHKAYYKRNKQACDHRMKKWEKANRVNLRIVKNKWKTNQKKSNPAFKLSVNMRERVRNAVKSGRGEKRTKTASLIGCSILDLMKHIESLWLPGMTWANYGFRGWHIDHIKPCASFDLTSESQQLACFHWSNMQPLWWRDNLSKGAKLQIDSSAKTS